jgi:hypothetical protein
MIDQPPSSGTAEKLRKLLAYMDGRRDLKPGPIVDLTPPRRRRCDWPDCTYDCRQGRDCNAADMPFADDGVPTGLIVALFAVAVVAMAALIWGIW